MDTEKKIVFVVMIIATFVFVVALSSLYVQTEVSAGNACGCAIPIWLFIPLLSSIGLLIGTLIYYLLRSGKQAETHQKAGFDVKEMASSFTKMLPQDEAAIVRLLIGNKGEMTQARLMKDSGYNKVKIHRIVKRLQLRGFVTKTKDRKINTIALREDIRKYLD
ncbi:MAG: hypothetical protein JW716_06010 [Candidatus Aenigmarchaeota archaeon]|nr:hypothetical protein [Candidatus Aenigmarchaeota archaeon]